MKMALKITNSSVSLQLTFVIHVLCCLRYNFSKSSVNIALLVYCIVQTNKRFFLYIRFISFKPCIYHPYSSHDPHEVIRALLAKYSSDPESEPQLKLLLPQIVSSFGGNKSVHEIIEELKRHQLSTDATGEILNAWCLSL